MMLLEANLFSDYVFETVCLFNSLHKKLHTYTVFHNRFLHCKRSERKSYKNVKNGLFGECLKNWILVVKQCFNWTKIDGKGQSWKFHMRLLGRLSNTVATIENHSSTASQRVRYRFLTHYISAVNLWNLLLAT